MMKKSLRTYFLYYFLILYKKKKIESLFTCEYHLYVLVVNKRKNDLQTSLTLVDRLLVAIDY